MSDDVAEQPAEIAEAIAPARRGDIETRSAPAMEVRFDERMIDIVAVPYDEHAIVEHRGRIIDETVERGAFEGVQMRVREFPRVNMAHDRERPIGRIAKFRPRDERGLIAELGPITRTRDGDDALELAADGLLGASVSFGVMPNGERWTIDRRARVVTKAWLDHIALTGAPAYAGAKVLAVRSAPTEAPPGSPTPNLDEVLAWLLAERYYPAQPST